MIKNVSQAFLFVCISSICINLHADGTVGSLQRARIAFNTTEGIDAPKSETKLAPELLPELLPRQVNELAVRLQIRHLFGYNDEKPVNNVLFHGPPGLGKTEAAKKIALDSGFHFVELPSTGLINKWQNSGSENFQKEIDDCIAHHTKTGQSSFIFMDEFDAIGKDVNDADATMVTNRQTEQAALMHIWQTILKYKNDGRLVFCFGTNKMKSLHKTFISRFREDNIIEFKLPTKEQRKIAFEHYLKFFEFSLEKELNETPAQAKKTLEMLVSHSDQMNLRAICDAVQSFKGVKSLSSLEKTDLERIIKYLQENDGPEIEKLKKEFAEQASSSRSNKIDKAIIALHEKLTGKPVAAKASTRKELYEILQRTKSKDGYNWQEEMTRLSEKMSKNVDPWISRLGLNHIIGTAVCTVAWYGIQVGVQVLLGGTGNAGNSGNSGQAHVPQQPVNANPQPIPSYQFGRGGP